MTNFQAEGKYEIIINRSKRREERRVKGEHRKGETNRKTE